MEIAVPSSVELVIATLAEAPDALAAQRAKGRRVFILAPGPREALALLEAGVSLASVNVGGLHHSAGKIQIGKALFLSAEDVAALKAIAAKGVTLEGRAVPSESPSDLASLLD